MQCGTKWKGFTQFLALRPLESQITPIRRITRIRLIGVIRFIRVIRDTISHLLKSGIEFCGSIVKIISEKLAFFCGNRVFLFTQEENK